MAVNYNKDYSPEELKQQEDQLASVPEEDKEALRSGAQKLESGEGLNEQEREAYDKHLGIKSGDSSAAEDINDKLNKGYTGKKDEKKTRTSKLFNSDSKLKKKVAIAGAAAGGGIILSIILFLALLPLKIEHIVDNLENKFSAASSQAIDTETENFYSSYVKQNVLPALNRKGCNTTVSANCVYGTEGKGAVGKLYAAWSQGRLEQKMATQYGIVLSSTGTGAGYSLTVQGHSYRLGSDGNIFNVQGTHGVSTNQARAEIRAAVKTGLQDATLYDKVFFRFKLGKFLESKYGIKRCVIACKLKDNFSDWTTNKKQAYQAFLVQRVISPMSGSYGLMLQCVIGGDGACPSSTPEDAPDAPDANGNEQRTSPLQQSIQDQLSAYAASFASEEAGKEAVDKLVANAHDISENGLGKHVASQVLSKALGKDVTSDTVGQALGPINWIKTVSSAVTNASGIGNKAKAIDYTAESAQAVQLASTFETVVNETRAGETDATMLGSFTDALSSADVHGNLTDATSTPLYSSYFGGSTSQAASIFGSLFGADTAGSGSSYKCDNNNPVPSGALICPEEDLAAGSAAASDISSFVNSIPLLSQAASVVSAVTSFGGNLNPLNWLSDISSALLQDVPGVSDLSNWLGSYASKITQPLIGLVTSKLLPSAISPNMGGGRTFDMAAGGFDVMENQSCQVELGCGQVSDVKAAAIQNEQIAAQKQQFDSQSMFARMFDTSSPYSLVSHLAMDMPTSMQGVATSGLASLFTNPIGKAGGIFSAAFSKDTAFADQPTTDPFHVAQMAMTNLPSDPESYWNEHCDAGVDGQAGDMGKYDESTDTLDISAWLNAKDANGNYINTGTDPNTGQSVNLNSNPCPTIHTVLQTGGALFDPSILPKNSQNDTGSSASDSTDTGTPSGVTGDAKSLAQKLLDEATAGKVVLTDSTKSDLQKTVQGQQVYIGDSAQGGGKCSAAIPASVSATLLQVLLNISAQYKITIQNIVSGHPCDTKKHSTGHASDIFQIDGEDLNDSWWAKPDDITITNNIGKIEHDTDPTNAFGLGIGCSAVGKVTAPSNITIFGDSGACAGGGSQDEIHVDVRGGS